MVKEVCGRICHLGESPLYDERNNALYYADIFDGAVYAHDCDSHGTRAVYEGELKPGGLCMDESGVLLLFTQKGVYTLHSQTAEKLFDFLLSPGENFNDVIADPTGRVFAGTLNRTPGMTGRLWRFEREKSPQALLEGLLCTNGMGFSGDGKTFYHTDSLKREITAYDYDIDTGNIFKHNIFYTVPDIGVPDGMSVDNKDYVWTTIWGSGCVRCISPQGECVQEIAIPARQPSSLAFGGRSLHTLYITSACEGADDLTAGTKNGLFLGGPLYAVETVAAGRIEYRARFL